MTAKRKPSQRKPPRVEATQSFEDELLIAFLETPDGKAWAKQLIEEAENPAIAKKRKRKEARHKSFHSFMRYLEELPASHTLPKGFQRKWLKWLGRFEREEKAKLPRKERADDRVGKWVKLAWVTTALNDPEESQTGRFAYHDKRPSAEKHPIPAILIRQKGRWSMPADQMLAAGSHPYIRAFCLSLPLLPDKAAILGKISWAQSLEGKPDSPESQLSHAAGHLSVALYGDVRKCLPEALDRCLPFDQLPETAPLWKLLNAAIGFGRMLQYQEIYGDGSVERLLRYGVTQVQACPQREAIADLMTEYRLDHEEEATAEALLEWIGVKRPFSDDAPIEFPDKRFDALVGIKWPAWNQHVKNVNRQK